MTPTRWQVVQSLVNAALDLPAEERAAFLTQVCAGDSELQREIWKLIQSYEDPDDALKHAVNAYAVTAFAPNQPVEGDRIGAYRITGIIGSGGMGTVYCANRIDDQFRQQVAIKVVGGGFGNMPELSTRFRAERQILANLIHPNIARLLDGGVGGIECGPRVSKDDHRVGVEIVLVVTVETESGREINVIEFQQAVRNLVQMIHLAV